jgi:K+-sensing histidine kinase KdpD
MKFKSLSSSLGWRPYRFACLAVAVATGCVGLLMWLMSLPVFVIYIAAISVSTSYGGVSAGTLAAALAFFASLFLFIPPYFSLASEQSVLSLLVFYCGTVVLNVIVTLAFLRRRGESQQDIQRKRSMSSNGKRMNGSHNPHCKH